MANLIYQLGPMLWDPEILGGCRRAPDGTTAMIDLSNLADCGTPGVSNGVGLFASEQPLGSGYDQLDSLQGAQSAFQKRLKYHPQGDTLPQMIADFLLHGADPTGVDTCPILQPGHDLAMPVMLGGEIFRTKFESTDWTRPYGNRLKQLVQGQIEAEFGDGSEKQKEHVGKVLDAMLGKYRYPREQWKDFVPAKLHGEIAGPTKHETALAESFNTADSSTLGPAYSWTEYGTWAIVSNMAKSTSTDAALRSARCGTAVSSADHYAESQLYTLSTGGGSYSQGGAMSRFAAAAQTAYCSLYSYNPTGTAKLFYTLKEVAGTATTLAGSTVIAFAQPTVDEPCRSWVSGSNLRGYNNATLTHDITDTAITTGTQGGIYGLQANSTNYSTINFWSMSDLFQGFAFTRMANVKFTHGYRGPR